MSTSSCFFLPAAAVSVQTSDPRACASATHAQVSPRDRRHGCEAGKSATKVVGVVPRDTGVYRQKCVRPSAWCTLLKPYPCTKQRLVSLQALFVLASLGARERQASDCRNSRDAPVYVCECAGSGREMVVGALVLQDDGALLRSD